MSDSVQGLYDGCDYPPMSHPATHPAVAGVAAAVAGLRVVPPSEASVLEIGCAGGWNLLPLAVAHPRAAHRGIDFAARGVATAQEVAAACGVENVVFEQADLRDWRPGQSFDHVIAHGVYSWVDAPARHALLATCRQALSSTGIACVSFNVRAGWEMRRQVVDVARAIARMTGDDPSAPLKSLEILEGAVPADNPHAAHLRWILGDMKAKGKAMLPFDDFAPVCDACSLTEFVAAAAAAGLRVLGESSLAANLPDGLDATSLAPLAGEPLLLQEACDLLGGRAHRVLVLCRDDVALASGVTTEVVGGMAARMLGQVTERDGVIEIADAGGEPQAMAEGGMAAALFRALARSAPSCVPVARLLESLPENNPSTRISACVWLFEAARASLVELRTEPVTVVAQPPEYPALAPLQRQAARRRWPLVDAFHRPLTLSDEQCRLLLAMDGSRDAEELDALATAHCPGLAFRPWLAYLCERGVIGTRTGDAS